LYFFISGSHCFVAVFSDSKRSIKSFKFAIATTGTFNFADTSALARDYQIDMPFAFNRKETKDHGEKGLIIGAPIEGRVLIVDDVITAGTAVFECARLIADLGGTLAGILISLDRQERGRETLSAVAEVSAKLNVPVVAIANLNDLIDLLESEKTATKQWLPEIKKYKARYGVDAD
jgi:orotate phosphoribosyltransferase